GRGFESRPRAAAQDAGRRAHDLAAASPSNLSDHGIAGAEQAVERPGPRHVGRSCCSPKRRLSRKPWSLLPATAWRGRTRAPRRSRSRVAGGQGSRICRSRRARTARGASGGWGLPLGGSRQRRCGEGRRAPRTPAEVERAGLRPHQDPPLQQSRLLLLARRAVSGRPAPVQAGGRRKVGCAVSLARHMSSSPWCYGRSRTSTNRNTVGDRCSKPAPATRNPASRQAGFRLSRPGVALPVAQRSASGR
ncbi:MAG: hypothetical protein QOI45_2624, partial [Thermoleophilaceae bacterium]|nr:hypothetical protein [Thermoleophilaceae bacterium]